MASDSNSDWPRVVVVIPTYNRWAEAKKTLASLGQSDYPNFEIVLVEDGCSDGSPDHCRKEFPDVRLLHGDGKLWWSGAINEGMKSALAGDADAIIWLNDDNQVEPQTLSEMVASFMRTGPRTIICARTKSTATGLDEWVGDPPGWHPEFGKWTPPDLSKPDVPVTHPPGGRGVLIPKQCFSEIGLVDRRAFPHYWADHDFHYRAMAAGYKYYLATNATIWNVPNAKRDNSPGEFSSGWAFQFVFSRRSPMNMITLHKLLKRHLSRREYRSIYYPLLWRSLTWLATGWAARKPVLHRSLRTLKKGIVSDKQG